MDITPLMAKGKLNLNRYGNGGFVINDISYKSNILIGADKVTPWPVADILTATTESFSPLLGDELPEILLIGSGKLFTVVPHNIRDYFRSKGIACDGMDTGAACRTYSVLLSEGRAVVAALIAI